MSSPSPPLTLRDLESDADLEATCRLQEAIWGEGFPERVAPALLRIGRSLGGVSAGAFLEGGTLAGFVFGLTGIDGEGHPLHWSHMCGVRSELRDHGIGRALKAFQRQQLAARGVERTQWSYEPLEARNAHLNLNILGCRVVAYRRNLYGDGSASPLHQGLGTDRFVVEQNLTGRKETPKVEEGKVTEVEIPAEIQRLKVEDPPAAVEWRRRTRQAFEEVMGAGGQVLGFRRDPATGRCTYLLSSPRS